MLSIQTLPLKFASIALTVSFPNRTGIIKLPLLSSVRAGILKQLGHMDFYPDGGSLQYGCVEQDDPNHPDNGGKNIRRGTSH